MATPLAASATAAGEAGHAGRYLAAVIASSTDATREAARAAFRRGSA